MNSSIYLEKLIKSLIEAPYCIKTSNFAYKSYWFKHKRNLILIGVLIGLSLYYSRNLCYISFVLEVLFYK